MAHIVVIGAEMTQRESNLKEYIEQLKSKGVKVFGDGVNSLSRKEVTELEGLNRKGNNIYIIAHGKILRGGKHVISLDVDKPPYVTGSIIRGMSKMSNVHLLSCYSGKAQKERHGLSKGARLWTYESGEESMVNNLDHQLKFIMSMVEAESLEESQMIALTHFPKDMACGESKSGIKKASRKPSLSRLPERPLSLGAIKEHIAVEFRRIFARDNDQGFPAVVVMDEDAVRYQYNVFSELIEVGAVERLEGEAAAHSDLFEAYKKTERAIVSTVFAAATNDVKMVVSLDRLGMSLSCSRSIGGATPITRASTEGSAEVIKVLAEAGVDIEAKNERGFPPIFLAAEFGHVGAVEVLIELGADVNSISTNGDSPVFIAAEKGHARVVEALAEAGADVDSINADGVSPVFIASQHGHAGVIRALAKAGANMDSGYDGNPPIYLAAQNAHIKAVRELAKAGADFERRNGIGKQAIDVVRYLGNDRMVGIIEEHIESVNRRYAATVKSLQENVGRLKSKLDEVGSFGADSEEIKVLQLQLQRQLKGAKSTKTKRGYRFTAQQKLNRAEKATAIVTEMQGRVGELTASIAEVDCDEVSLEVIGGVGASAAEAIAVGRGSDTSFLGKESLLSIGHGGGSSDDRVLSSSAGMGGLGTVCSLEMLMFALHLASSGRMVFPDPRDTSLAGGGWSEKEQCINPFARPPLSSEEEKALLREAMELKSTKLDWRARDAEARYRQGGAARSH